MKIIIPISNYPSSTIIKRVLEISYYTKNYEEQVYLIPYVIKHYDIDDSPLLCIPDHISTLIANNELRIWVRPDYSYSDVFIEDGAEIGMFDYLQQLQKATTDQNIIMSQILKLDSENRFNNYENN